MPRTIAVSPSDQTMFHVAARETGDALLAWRLMQASGMTDPFIDAFQTVTIPDGRSPPGDGLAPHG